jgi:hypothetical protein
VVIECQRDTNGTESMRSRMQCRLRMLMTRRKSRFFQPDIFWSWNNKVYIGKDSYSSYKIHHMNEDIKWTPSSHNKCTQTSLYPIRSCISQRIPRSSYASSVEEKKIPKLVMARLASSTSNNAPCRPFPTRHSSPRHLSMPHSL